MKEFKMYDAIRDGVISFDELVAVKDALKIPYGSQAALLTRFNAADRNGYRGIDSNEWVTALLEKGVMAEQGMKDIFRGFDMNHDNFLSEFELTSVWTKIINNLLLRLGGHMPEEHKHLNWLLNNSLTADMDGNGQLSYCEFLALF